MGDRGLRENDLLQVLLRVGNALQDRLGNLGCLAQAIAHGALAVADDDESGELHNAAALDRLGNTVQVDDALNHLRSIVLFGRSVISHFQFLLLT